MGFGVGSNLEKGGIPPGNPVQPTAPYPAQQPNAYPGYPVQSAPMGPPPPYSAVGQPGQAFYPQQPMQPYGSGHLHLISHISRLATDV